MTDIEACLSQINAIRAVAAGVEPAYVARSRLGRLTLTASAMVASRLGIEPPELPHQSYASVATGSVMAPIAVSCDRLTELSRHLSQPSEPLQERWVRGWSSLLAQLDLLEQQLKAVVLP
jgi:hypothetical protein